jgi:uncharacterized membrane protein YphA (DoxX/SURF4 family)
MEIRAVQRGRVVSTAARYVLAGVFLVSAVGKAASPHSFSQFVSSLSFLVWINGTLLLVGVIILEVSLGLLLLFPQTGRVGAMGSLAALVLFTGMLMHSLLTEVNLECGCFGEIVSGVPVEIDIIRNLVLALLSGLVIDGPTREVKREKPGVSQ